MSVGKFSEVGKYMAERLGWAKTNWSAHREDKVFFVLFLLKRLRVLINLTMLNISNVYNKYI